MYKGSKPMGRETDLPRFWKSRLHDCLASSLMELEAPIPLD